jgi:hypothetical protein
LICVGRKKKALEEVWVVMMEQNDKHTKTELNRILAVDILGDQ